MSQRAESGLAMVQVLVMSVLLMILVVGVMRLIFGTHVLVSRQVASDRQKGWVNACRAWRNETWAGTPCKAGETSCDYTGQGGPNITITCSVAGSDTQVKYTVNW